VGDAFVEGACIQFEFKVVRVPKGTLVALTLSPGQGKRLINPLVCTIMLILLI